MLAIEMSIEIGTLEIADLIERARIQDFKNRGEMNDESSSTYATISRG